MTDPTHIYNWRRVDERLTTSGQPAETEVEELQQLGITHIINLGLHDHERALADESTTVASLGMRYVHIPVAFDNPTEDDFEQFCASYSELGDTKVHIHCIANLRVTAFLYRFHRNVLGMKEARARRPMDSVWRPGGVWAKFIGDDKSIVLPHRPPIAVD